MLTTIHHHHPQQSTKGGYQSKVTKLNLRGNDITDEGAKVMKEALVGSISLTCLNLSWNPIGSKGCYELCSLVEVSKERFLEYEARGPLLLSLFVFLTSVMSCVYYDSIQSLLKNCP